jgi:hypothetical protein
MMEVMAISVAVAAAIFGARFFLNGKFLADANCEFGHVFLLSLERYIGVTPSYVNQIIIII